MKIRPLEEKPLSLTNDGRLSLFFIGIGSAFTKRQYQTNFLIVKGQDHVLVDCGTKTPQALSELRLKLGDVQNYLITHSHADHIGGLEEVMLIGRYMTQIKPTIIINKSYQHYLWDMSLKGGSAFNESHDNSEYTVDFEDMWNVIHPVWLKNFPRTTYEADVGSINLKIFRTMHIPDGAADWQTSFFSCGVIIDNRVMFSGDTRYDPDLIRSFNKRVKPEIIFHDCQFFTGGVHAGLEELKDLPVRIKKKMILVHYGDDWEKHEDRVSEYGFRGLGKQWCFYEFR